MKKFILPLLLIIATLFLVGALNNMFRTYSLYGGVSEEPDLVESDAERQAFEDNQKQAVEDSQDERAVNNTQSESDKMVTETVDGLKNTVDGETYYSRVEFETSLLPTDWKKYTYEEGSLGLYYPSGGSWIREGPQGDVAEFYFGNKVSTNDQGADEGIYFNIYS